MQEIAGCVHQQHKQKVFRVDVKDREERFLLLPGLMPKGIGGLRRVHGEDLSGRGTRGDRAPGGT